MRPKNVTQVSYMVVLKHKFGNINGITFTSIKFRPIMIKIIFIKSKKKKSQPI